MIGSSSPVSFLNAAEEKLIRGCSVGGFHLLAHQAAGVDRRAPRLELAAAAGGGPAGGSFPRSRSPAVLDAPRPSVRPHLLAPKLAEPALFNERQVVALPAAETLFPSHQTLDDLALEEYNISLGYPPTRTPVFTFFERLLQVIQSADAEGRSMRRITCACPYPYTKNIHLPGPGRRSDLTRDLTPSRRPRPKKGRAFWAVEEIAVEPAVRVGQGSLVLGVEGAPVPADFLTTCGPFTKALLEPLRTIASVGDFAGKLSRVLDFVYENGTARRHYFFHPYAEAFCARLERLAGSPSGHGLRGAGRIFQPVPQDGRGRLRSLFRQCARGLQVLGFWETRGIPFEEVYLLDVNEDVLPASRRGDSLLPPGVRRALGLPASRDKEREIEHYLDVLIGGARRVHLFFVEGRDRERSRYVERLLWESRKRDPRKKSETPVGTVRYRAALGPYRPDEIPKTDETVRMLRELSYSATSLDAYLRCPLRFHYRYVLGLREREEIDEEIEAKDVGLLVHRVLEEEFAPLLGRPLRPEDFPAGRLSSRVEELFRRAFGPNLSGRAYLMLLQTKRHLVDYINRCQVEVILACRAENKDIVILDLENRIRQGEHDLAAGHDVRGGELMS